MIKEKIINDLKYLKIAIEWDNPLDYQTMITNAITYIENSVEQKHGHWNRENSDYDCSNCGNSLSNIMDADSYYAIGFDGVPYCPYCGAKMDEVTE